MAASLKSDEELVDWFRQRLVWDDPAVVQDLLKRGLFSRIYTPQVVATPFTVFKMCLGNALDVPVCLQPTSLLFMQSPLPHRLMLGRGRCSFCDAGAWLSRASPDHRSSSAAL